jgi:enamine deaminase RidA (YjgF/YER057c/UK114 family)
MRPIRDRYLNVAHPPAFTFVVVSRLSRRGWLIEIEASRRSRTETKTGLLARADEVIE